MEVTIETLRLAQEGDDTAQQHLMQFLYTPVFHFLLKRTGNTDVASELCQNTFLKCYERVAQYKVESGTVYTWVFTIARNTLIDYYRAKRDDPAEDLAHLPASDVTSDPTATARSKLDQAYVARLLAQLPEHEADVVTLRAIDGMSYQLIAEIVDKSEPAVRQIYSRALKKLHILSHQDHV